jgi:hypothetical protein
VSETIPLRTVDREPVPEVVELLRGLLARAEAGEIVAVGAAVVLAGGGETGGIGTGWHAANVWPLLGAVTRLQHTIARTGD